MVLDQSFGVESIEMVWPSDEARRLYEDAQRLCEEAIQAVIDRHNIKPHQTATDVRQTRNEEEKYIQIQREIEMVKEPYIRLMVDLDVRTPRVLLRRQPV
jgi:hypothetical protein